RDGYERGVRRERTRVGLCSARMLTTGIKKGKSWSTLISCISPSKLLAENRQRPDSLLRRRIDRVAECWRERRHGRLSDSRRRFSAGNGIDFHRRSFCHARGRVIVEIALH